MDKYDIFTVLSGYFFSTGINTVGVCCKYSNTQLRMFKKKYEYTCLNKYLYNKFMLISIMLTYGKERNGYVKNLYKVTVIY